MGWILPLYPFLNRQTSLARTRHRAGDLLLFRSPLTQQNQLHITFVKQTFLCGRIFQLRGFEKVYLEAGETKTVPFKFAQRDLALVDLHMKTVVEPGEFEVMVGSSSARIQLQGRFTVGNG